MVRVKKGIRWYGVSDPLSFVEPSVATIAAAGPGASVVRETAAVDGRTGTADGRRESAVWDLGGAGAMGER